MNAHELGVVDGMTKVAVSQAAMRSGAVAVSLVDGAQGDKVKKPKKKQEGGGDPQQMGMGAFTMRRGGEIQKTVPNQQPPKPPRY
jgi:hypothetical protein